MSILWTMYSYIKFLEVITLWNDQVKTAWYDKNNIGVVKWIDFQCMCLLLGYVYFQLLMDIKLSYLYYQNHFQHYKSKYACPTVSIIFANFYKSAWKAVNYNSNTLP